MAVNESLYDRLRDAGFSHFAALIFADPDNTDFAGGSIGAAISPEAVQAAVQEAVEQADLSEAVGPAVESALEDADIAGQITEALNTAIEGLQDAEQVQTAIQNALENVVPDMIGNAIGAALEDFSTTDEMTEAIGTAVAGVEVDPPDLSGYVETADLEGAVASYLVANPPESAPFEMELDAAEKTASQTMTGVSVSGAAPTAITGLAIDVTGNGRPIEIRFDAITWHSVANTIVIAVLLQDGVVLGIIGATASPLTTGGTSLRGFRRLVLSVDEEHQYTVGLYATAAGNVTLSASAAVPVALSATSR